MSWENDEHEMRSEYDIRGGTRGRYLEEYRRQGHHLVFEDSPFIYTSTSGAAERSNVTSPASNLPLSPSPTIQIGALEPAASGR